jgi:hypothetical protein
MSVTQGRHGYVSIGGTIYYMGQWSYDDPENIQVPMPVGNSFATHYGKGLQAARIAFTHDLRQTEAGTLAFWNMWLARTWTSNFDQTSSVTLILADGALVNTYTNARPEAFVLAAASGQQVGLQSVFVAASAPTESNQTVADYSKTADATAPLMFDQLSFSSFSADVYGFELRYANNHVVDAPLNQSKRPQGFDPGPMTCSARFTFKSYGTARPFTAGQSLDIAILTSPTQRVLTLECLVPQDPRGRNVSTGQVFKPVEFAVLGSTSYQPLRCA